MKPTEWIKCAVNMPLIGQLVIFITSNKRICAGRYIGNDEWEISCLCILASDQCEFLVTHWAKLPEPPND